MTIGALRFALAGLDQGADVTTLPAELRTRIVRACGVLVDAPAIHAAADEIARDAQRIAEATA